MRFSRIHIFGASGSGTTTLAAQWASRLTCPHFDTDRYFWEDTEEPFSVIRPEGQRLERMRRDLSAPAWILSGSLCGWGDSLIPLFDLAVFVYVPKALRMERLRKRELQRYGSRVEPGGDRYRNSVEFLTWAAGYDDSTEIGRSLKRHEQWIAQLPCPVVRLDNSLPLESSFGCLLESVRALSSPHCT